MADPVFAEAEELRAAAEPPERGTVRGLLARRDFRRLYVAVCTSELGDAFHYIAVMWLALEAAGPLGVVSVRLADSLPALLFGLHGGLAADRWNRKTILVAADLVRAAVLVPLAVVGLAGGAPLAALVVVAFVLETGASYFAPAYGALVPELVDRENVQRANGLVQASVNALSIGGWALAAALLAVLPLAAFFAVNAASFAVSALLIAGLRHGRERATSGERPRIREGLAALRPRPALAAAVAVIGVAVTLSSGTWIGGVPELVRSTLGRGAASFSVVMVGYAVGSIAGGALLARFEIRRKARASMLAWLLYLPAYGLLALAGSLPLAVLGSALAGIGQGTALVLASSAAQQTVPNAVLGRVLGLISLTHRGGHATGLLLVAPLFAFVSPPAVFAAAALAIPLAGLAGLAVSARAGAARAPARARTPRS